MRFSLSVSNKASIKSLKAPTWKKQGTLFSLIFTSLVRLLINNRQEKIFQEIYVHVSSNKQLKGFLESTLVSKWSQPSSLDPEAR